MRLSWNEIRARAATFAEEWRGASYERGQTQTFYNEFFDVFGVQRRKVASFEEPVKKLGNKQGFIDLLWKGVLLVEHKSARRDLARAKTQALEYFPGLKDAEKPRYILLSDFQNFILQDREELTEVAFPLTDLSKQIEHFGFILGVQKRSFRDQDPVNIKASELMGRLHDALKASGYEGDDLERLLVRLVFCLFADDTGIFERENFLDLIRERSQDDGSDTGRLLNELFDVLNTPEGRRQKQLDENLAKFPYVNGDLFATRLPTPAFDRKMRDLLVEACEFNWEAVSPAIFGSLFQSVMSAKERRASGAHYTTEKNIMKVIQPLFLDDLRAEFARIKTGRGAARERALAAFHDKLAGLIFFDPACGCGNFLIIAYRELRQLELELLVEMRQSGQRELDIAALCKVDVNQFYGIEIGEFATRIAEVALWMMDHIMNNRLSLQFGQAYARIPIKASPHIHHADALELDWDDVLDAEKCSYILGNPPFSGAKYQSDHQRRQVRAVAGLGGSGGTLDYVCAWFLKAGAFAGYGGAKIGFVATNSITQGEQVAQLWPLLFDRCKLEISFAHRTFAWGSDARGKAHVHVVIIGLSKRGAEPSVKRLFSYDDINGDPVETPHGALTAYLFDAGGVANRHLVVSEVRQPLGDAPKMVIGSKPIDGGHYIFSGEQRFAFLKVEPQAGSFLHPFVGAEEYINGGDRWILNLSDASPTQLRSMPLVMARVAAVRKIRESSSSKPTQQLAATPTRFHVTVIPEKPFLCVPKVSSERRSYVPIGWLTPPTIPSDLVFVLQNANLVNFAILTSVMHMAWLRQIGGRLKSDYRYSIGIVYNTFPWPQADVSARAKISELAQAVLDARAQFPQSTLADLYDPDVMPAPLRKAHQALDKAVDKLYRPTPFAGDRERVEHLFGLYEKLIAPLTAITQRGKAPRRLRS